MIHARSDGESFGLSIGEFLYYGKPVLTFGDCRDKNNIHLVTSCGFGGLVFNNQYELLQSFFHIKNNSDDYSFWSPHKCAIEIIKQNYSPEVVMKKFDEVFLSA